MKIEKIRAHPGARKKVKRRGRGVGSGHGKTSCRGHKGSKSRSGTTQKPGFEGGQMPLIRRLPKRGFTPRIPAVYQVVNLESLNAFDRDAIVEPKDLFNAGIINKRRLPVKILGGGELRHALTVRANAFSRQAEEKIKQANGRAERIERQ